MQDVIHQLGSCVLQQVGYLDQQLLLVTWVIFELTAILGAKSSFICPYRFLSSLCRVSLFYLYSFGRHFQNTLRRS